MSELQECTLRHFLITMLYLLKTNRTLFYSVYNFPTLIRPDNVWFSHVLNRKATVCGGTRSPLSFLRRTPLLLSPSASKMDQRDTVRAKHCSCLISLRVALSIYSATINRLFAKLEWNYVTCYICESFLCLVHFSFHKLESFYRQSVGLLSCCCFFSKLIWFYDPY